tara:strand:+ start:1714 stop:2289 length:576 start_codon:yes stop_codon:yes gene_type:complete
MPAAMTELAKPPSKVCVANGLEMMDYSKIVFRPNPTVNCNDKPISLHCTDPDSPYTDAIKTRDSLQPSHHVNTNKNVMIDDKSVANESDMEMWHNLRQKYGSGGSTPTSNTCGGGGPGNTTNGVPPDYQWYLPSVEANPGDADWDKCNKTGVDLTKIPPSNPNPLQSYYGIYDSAIKKKLEKMISPNVMVG